jgi:uncharacterized damage-inducible protein DinB
LSRPEVWLRGPVEGIHRQLQPVAHALLQSLEDAERLAGALDTTTLWRSPGNAATIGFHLRHMAGSLDRLLTYARGEPLTEEQKAVLGGEKDITPEVTAAELLANLRRTIAAALAQLRATRAESLDDTRPVGRAGHPSSVRGLLYHAGEHTARHVGQISTTLLALARP